MQLPQLFMYVFLILYGLENERLLTVNSENIVEEQTDDHVQLTDVS